MFHCYWNYPSWPLWARELCINGPFTLLSLSHQWQSSKACKAVLTNCEVFLQKIFICTLLTLSFGSSDNWKIHSFKLSLAMFLTKNETKFWATLSSESFQRSYRQLILVLHKWTRCDDPNNMTPHHHHHPNMKTH